MCSMGRRNGDTYQSLEDPRGHIAQRRGRHLEPAGRSSIGRVVGLPSCVIGLPMPKGVVADAVGMAVGEGWEKKGYCRGKNACR
jgi:hypothetical protein